MCVRERERLREFFIENPLVRIHFIVVMTWWTGLAPWEFEFPFPGSRISTFLGMEENWALEFRSRTLLAEF